MSNQPTYMDQELVDAATKAWIPDRALATVQIDVHASHEDDDRLEKPILEVIEQAQGPASEASSSEAEEELKEPTVKECLVNIAASTHGACTKPQKPSEDQHFYIMDVSKNLLHLQAYGWALCWEKMGMEEARTKRRQCIYVDEVGTTEICKTCLAAKAR